jgi:hypothetical protein
VTLARRNICLIAAAAAALSATALIPGRAAAVATAGHSDTPTTTLQVVATGLNVPRGLVYDREHNRLLIAESGVAAGNNGPCATGAGGQMLCYGATGSVYSFPLGQNGQAGRIVTGLPSISDSGKKFVKGLEGLSLYCGRLSGVFSLSGPLATRTGLGPGAADLGQAVVFGQDGTVTPIADIAAKEAQLYGADMVSDPWGISTGDFGAVIANSEGTPPAGSEFGGNDILQLKGGELTQMVAFPQRVDQNGVVEAGPATVVRGPDGAFYVGELTSFPYYVGEARIWRVVPGQAPTVFGSGFTKIIDIAFDSHGRMLVLEVGKQHMDGALIRIDRNGTQTVLASTGLTDTGGIAVVNDHTFYITNFTGGVGGDGQLVKITVNDGD